MTKRERKRHALRVEDYTQWANIQQGKKRALLIPNSKVQKYIEGDELELRLLHHEVVVRITFIERSASNDGSLVSFVRVSTMEKNQRRLHRLRELERMISYRHPRKERWERTGKE